MKISLRGRELLSGLHRSISLPLELLIQISKLILYGAKTGLLSYQLPFQLGDRCSVKVGLWGAFGGGLRQEGAQAAGLAGGRRDRLLIGGRSGLGLLGRFKVVLRELVETDQSSF